MKTLLFVFVSVLLGAISLHEWTEIFVLGFFGALAYKLVSYNNTGKGKKYSPESFHFSYWIQDRGNWNDMVLGLVLFFFIARFKAEFFEAFNTNIFVQSVVPFANSPLFYLMLGFLMTFIIKKIRSWNTNYKKNKD